VAGSAAAAEAARAGASTVVVEQTRDAEERRGAGDGALAELVSEAESAGARILLGTPAFGVFDGPIVAAAGENVLYRIRARHLIFATGAVEQPAVFPNNDLPGVVLSSAVERLVRRFRVLPGRTAVVYTASERGHETARIIREAGAEALVVDLRPDAPSRDGVETIAGSAVLSASGRRRVTAVTVGPPGAADGTKVPCDLLVLAGFSAPSTNLLAMTGAQVAFDDRMQAFLPVRLPPNVHAAGEVAGAPSVGACVAQGRLAGIEAAAALGYDVEETTDRIEALRAQAAEEGDPILLPPELGMGGGKQFACVCMDVTNKELKLAVAEGFDSMELLKRYTTITMGPCQGKACMLSSQRLCATATGRTFAETRPTTARPPWTPVELGTLAGTRPTPRKQTSIHELHADAGAEFMWAGDWRRAHHYRSPEEEVDAVRHRVGLIDVSSLGKFRVKGPEAVSLLERLYPNRFEDLDIWRIRYGVMLNDEGVIVDDGAVVRVAQDEFFVTVTTGNTAALDRWITWWLADWRLDVRVLNVSGAYASMNLAGPNSRDVMQGLTDADVSAAVLPYMRAAQMEIANVPAIVLRIGFVGELGYEIHVPSMYGEHVWRTIMDAGETHGILPFGLEAQRILRLEKHHILVGQDTDAESDPYEVGLGWLVKEDKPDFLGKRALDDLRRAGPNERLVGFTCEGDWVPPEGASIVHDGAWVGRVTSARRSAAAGSIVGLAWVPAARAADGTPIEVEFGAVGVRAVVATKPPYDPDGVRLRG
jgi:sarcosine oxidase subunit alpha